MPLDARPQVAFSHAQAPLTSQLTQDLCKMRALLSARERWTTGTCARDEDYKTVPVAHPSATRFCLLGAVLKARRINQTPAYGTDIYVKTITPYDLAISKAAEELGFEMLRPLPAAFKMAAINDEWCGPLDWEQNRGHERILQVLDLAIIQSLQ